MQMERSYTVGYVCAAIGAFVTLALAYDARRLRRFTLTLAASILILALHPAWTVAVIRGDCSAPRIPASYFVTGVFVVLAIVEYVFAKRASRLRSSINPR